MSDNNNNNKFTQNEDLDTKIYEKPKLSRSNSRIKSVTDAVSNNNYIENTSSSHINKHNKANENDTYYILEMYYNK